MVTRESASVSQGLLVESRHKIAMSRMVVAHSLFVVTCRRGIGGASDTNGTQPQKCHHANMVHFPGHGSYSEVCAARDEFATEFPNSSVSPVVRSRGGAWEWIFCPECAVDSESLDEESAT